MPHSWRSALLAALALLLLSGCLPTGSEEDPRFSVSGAVMTSCNTPVSGIAVTLEPEKQGRTLSDTTGADGRFEFPAVRGYAEYLLRLHLPAGFLLRPEQRPDVRVPVGNTPPEPVRFHVQHPGEFAEITLFVAAQTRACTTWYGQTLQCLQVREEAEREWKAISTPIEGFQHEVGYQYELRVQRHRNPCPPADGPAVTYRLLRVVSRTAATPQG